MATPIPSNNATFLLPEVALATHGAVVHRGLHSDEPAVGVTSDSRAVKRGGLFVALRGETHDGHAFVDKAIERGARIVVVERRRAVEIPIAPAETSIVEVDDTLLAWGALAKAHLTKWRNDSLDGRVIAITGSSGKTTTKELTAALLSEVAPTHFTAGNLNNRIGVPAVIFALETSHRFCVLEVGMSLVGELDKIMEFAKPDVSVIVNVGLAHSEGVGGREGVMQEKGAVYRALGHDGIAIINADDDYVCRAARRARVRKFETFGRGVAQASRRPGSFAEEDGALSATRDSVRVRASLPPDSLAARPTQPGSSPPHQGGSNPPSSDRLGGPPHYRLIDRIPTGAGSRLIIACAGRDLVVQMPLPGEAPAIDLMAALAAQEAASRELLSAAAIEHALASIRLEGRGTVRRLAGDIVVLDDTYNANPSSMRAALKTLAELSGVERRRVVVLGEMKELGDHAEAEHDALGDEIAMSRVALAIGCGGLITRTLERAAAGNGALVVLPCGSTEEAAREAADRIRPGDAVLIKGSRSVGAERVVAALVAKSPETLPNSSESASDGS